MLHLLFILLFRGIRGTLRQAFIAALTTAPSLQASTTTTPPPVPQETIITGMPPVAIPVDPTVPATTAPVAPPVTLPDVTLPPVTPTVPEASTTLPTVPDTLPTEVPSLAPAEGDFLALTNQARANANLESLAWSGELSAFANNRLSHIIDKGLAHSSNGQLLALANRGNRDTVGENLGVGTSITVIQEALMASPTHRENILWPSFTEFGSASAIGEDGRIWTVHIYGTPEIAKGTPERVPRAIRGN